MKSTELPAFRHDDIDYKRFFFDTGTKNDLDHNLTELRVASDATNNNPDENDVNGSIGFTRHPDSWAHLLRYYYAGKMIDKTGATSILDVGCGELQLPWFLNKNRFKPAPDAHYVGIELRGRESWLTAKLNDGPKYRYKAHMTLARGDIVRDDFSQAPGWQAGGFDLVISFECMEHVPRSYAKTFVQRLYDWTKPGGVCLLSTPNAGVSVSAADNHHGSDGECREWSYQDKMQMVKEAGFNVLRTYGTFTGKTYLPADVQQKIKTDQTLSAMREFFDTSLFNAIIAAAYPENSNNAIMHMVKPS